MFSMPDRVRIDIRLPEDLKARAREIASAQGRSLNSLIEEGVRKILDEPQDVDGRVKPGHDHR
jgi:predicted transcriptional regulator